MNKETALQQARIYCEQNGLKFAPLAEMDYRISRGVGIFCVKNDTPVENADGTIKDLETLPYFVLFVSEESGKYIVEQGEYARKYLA